MTSSTFANPSHDTARTFRAILDAIARPGHVAPLAAGIAPPQPLFATTAAIALTLCDFQTPLWLDPVLRTHAVSSYLRFHTGAPIVPATSKAAFAFIGAGQTLPDLREFARGTLEYPDRSATLVIQVQSLNSRAGVRMSGPGIKAPINLDAPPVGVSFWRQMIAYRGAFPLGIDVIFAAAGAVAACPRSTSLAFMESEPCMSP